MRIRDGFVTVGGVRTRYLAGVGGERGTGQGGQRAAAMVVRAGRRRLVGDRGAHALGTPPPCCPAGLGLLRRSPRGSRRLVRRPVPRGAAAGTPVGSARAFAVPG